MVKRHLFATALSESEMIRVKDNMDKEGFTNKSKYIRKKLGLE